MSDSPVSHEGVRAEAELMELDFSNINNGTDVRKAATTLSEALKPYEKLLTRDELVLQKTHIHRDFQKTQMHRDFMEYMRKLDNFKQRDYINFGGSDFINSIYGSDLREILKWFYTVAAIPVVRMIESQEDPVQIHEAARSKGCDVNNENVRYCLCHGTLQIFTYFVKLPEMDVNKDFFRNLCKAPDLHKAEKVRVLLEREDLNINISDHSINVPPLHLLGGEVRDVILSDPRTDVNVTYENRTALHTCLFGRSTYVERLERNNWFGNADAKARADAAASLEVQRLLRHPNIDVNKFCYLPSSRDMFLSRQILSGYQPPLFAMQAFRASRGVVRTFLEDERVILSLRNQEGKSLLDVEKANNADGDDGFPYDDGGFGWEEIIRDAEQQRLQWAKDKLKVLLELTVPPLDKHPLDADMLSTYLLPYVADVLHPIAELGGGALE
eukprot:gene89-119_t